MQLEITKQTTDRIDVETPSFYKRHAFMYSITDSCIISVGPSSLWINKVEDSKGYTREIVDAIKGEKITCEEFDQAYCKTRKEIDLQFDQITEDNLEGVGALAD